MDSRTDSTRTAPKSGRRFSRILVSLVAIVGLSAGSVVIAPAATAGTRVGAVATYATGVQRTWDIALMQYINEARTAHKLVPLREVDGLTTVSIWWGKQLIAGKTGHKLQHNPTAKLQVRNWGARNWLAWGENVGVVRTNGVTPKQLFDAYMASPSHRANILNPRYRFVGMGSVANGATLYNAMEFTDRADSTAVIRTVPTRIAATH